MKKFLALALVLVMTLCCVSVVAEESDEVDDFKASLTMAEAVSLESAEGDLDGDGTNETVELWMEVGTDEYENEFDYVTVKVADTEIEYGFTDFCYDATMFLEDLDGNGCAEIYVTMTYDDDYNCTYVLQMADGALATISAPDLAVDESTYVDYISGYVTGCYDGQLRVVTYVYVLGTYAAERVLTLKDGRFEVADDGTWIVADTGDDRWESQALTLLTDMEVEFSDGTGTLKAGEKILVTATDYKTVVDFVTEDGREGTLNIAADDEMGYGYTVNGVNEYEVFETLPYAG